MSGVEVRIVCRFKAASSTTTETITFSANRTTNEFGLYKTVQEGSCLVWQEIRFLELQIIIHYY
ncbi:unnamed protein product [Arabidopsis thaliana]|uniref:Uncharacterized protein n=1 Tax=Arabidopsis thaliana TaxID=3702 RepID=Q9LSD9_ARATH|nr:unnamed protein product [Arabidopsis thaliana]